MSRFDCNLCINVSQTLHLNENIMLWPLIKTVSTRRFYSNDGPQNMFYGDILVIIPKLSLLPLLIWKSVGRDFIVMGQRHFVRKQLVIDRLYDLNFGRALYIRNSNFMLLFLCHIMGFSAHQYFQKANKFLKRSIYFLIFACNWMGDEPLFHF